MIKQVATCDVCGASRGEGNKWFSAWIGNVTGPRFGIYQPESDEHICSEQCAHKCLQQWLDKLREAANHECEAALRETEPKEAVNDLGD